MIRVDKSSWRTDIADRFDAETNRSARISSAFGYLFFFIPLTMHPESKFARYHANQGLLLMLWMTGGLMLTAILPYIGPFLLVPAILFGIVFGVRGIITALRCQAKHIPVLGKLVLLEFEQFYSIEL